MKRQQNTTQMKGKSRTTEVHINEEEIGKLPEKGFIIMIVKMIKNLENKMEKMQESINKDLEELKNKHTETNNAITETKNTLEGINTLSEEEWINELKDKMLEITSEEQNKVKKNEKNWGWSQRPLGQYKMHQHSNYTGSRIRRQKEERIQPWSLGKGDLKHSKFKKKEKAEKYYANEGTS